MFYLFLFTVNWHFVDMCNYQKLFLVVLHIIFLVLFIFILVKLYFFTYAIDFLFSSVYTY